MRFHFRFIAFYHHHHCCPCCSWCLGSFATDLHPFLFVFNCCLTFLLQGLPSPWFWNCDPSSSGAAADELSHRYKKADAYFVEIDCLSCANCPAVSLFLFRVADSSVNLSLSAPLRTRRVPPLQGQKVHRLWRSAAGDWGRDGSHHGS